MHRARMNYLAMGGDIITAISGLPVVDLQALTVYLETETAIGDTVQLTILPGGKEITIPVTLGEQPQAQPAGWMWGVVIRGE